MSAVQGSISRETFHQCLYDFIKLSESIHDVWQAKKANNSGEEIVYMCKRQTVGKNDSAIQINEPDTETDADVDLQCQEILPLDESTINCVQLTSYTYDYHVIYNSSYGVPVLYFNAYHHGGKLLTIDEVWANVACEYRSRLDAERWTFLTQQEHPLLGCPFYQLHPCYTEQLMSQAGQIKPNSNYLITWLSTVAPVVGLSIPLTYVTKNEAVT